MFKQTGNREHRHSESASSPSPVLQSRVGVSLRAPHLPPSPFAAQGQNEGGGFYGAGNQTGSGAQRGPPLAAGVGPPSSQPLNFELGAGRGQGQGRTLMIFPSFYSLLEYSIRQGRQRQQGLCLLSYGGDGRPVSKYMNRSFQPGRNIMTEKHRGVVELYGSERAS